MILTAGKRALRVTGGKAGASWFRARGDRAPAGSAAGMMCFMVISDGKMRPVTKNGVDSVEMLGYL